MSANDYNLIVAVDSKWGMAKNKLIPWYSPTDFKFFKQQTKDSVCVYGRNTHDEIYEKLGKSLLPGRKNLVITSKPLLSEGIVCANVTDALFLHAKNYAEKSVFFCGGPRVYEESFAYVSNAYVSVIEDDFDCDTYFPYEKFLEKFLLKSSERTFCNTLNKYIAFQKFERIL